MAVELTDAEFFTGLEQCMPKLFERSQNFRSALPSMEGKPALVDLSKIDAKALVEEYTKWSQSYATLPFDIPGDYLRLYPGGLTIWSGYPGAGKTTLLRQFICQTLQRGSSVFFANLEENKTKIISTLVGTAVSQEIPTAHQVQWFFDAFEDRFFLWDGVGITDRRRLLKVIEEVASRGMRHAVVDSLMCLDLANNDINEQKNFANELVHVARNTRAHIHLVAHPRKPSKHDITPEVGDVAGAHEIGSIADNVLFVRKAKDGSGFSDASPMVISVRKQRHGNGWNGDIAGWYHKSLRQFHVNQFPSGPARYLPDDAYGA
jgi:twinkle protein